MDTEEQPVASDVESSSIPAQEDQIIEAIEGSNDEVTSSDLSTPKPNPLEDIFEQRRKHRDKLLNSILWLMWCSFALLAIMLIGQSVRRLAYDPTFVLLDETTLRIISVSIFGQTIAIVYVISKALWDDKIYMDIFKGK